MILEYLTRALGICCNLSLFFQFFEVPLWFANRVLKSFQLVLRTILKSDQLSSFTVNFRAMLLASMVFLIFVSRCRWCSSVSAEYFMKWVFFWLEIIMEENAWSTYMNRRRIFQKDSLEEDNVSVFRFTKFKLFRDFRVNSVSPVATWFSVKFHCGINIPIMQSIPRKFNCSLRQFMKGKRKKL